MAPVPLWGHATGRSTLNNDQAQHGGGVERRSLGITLPPVAAVLPDSEFTLLELADRLLNKGVVLAGEATISVAGVDLVYLGLNVVLTAVENLRNGGGSLGTGDASSEPNASATAADASSAGTAGTA